MGVDSVMPNEEHFSWRSVLATFLWLLAALGGLTLLQPLLVVFFAIGAAIGSGDPTAVTADKYRIVSARYFGVVIYGVVWLAGIITAARPCASRRTARCSSGITRW